MRRLLATGLVFLSCAAGAAQIRSVTVAQLPTCKLGSAQIALVVDGVSPLDCSVGGAAAGSKNEVPCICSAGSWKSLVRGGPVLLSTMNPAVDIDNSAAETDIFSYSVPAGTMTYRSALRLVLDCDYLNNSGVARFLTTRVKFGGTTWISYDDPTIASSATRRPRQLSVTVQSLDSLAVQNIFLKHEVTLDSSPGTLNTGDLAVRGATTTNYVRETATNIDTTSAQTLAVTIQLSVADAGLEFHCYTGALEIVN